MADSNLSTKTNGELGVTLPGDQCYNKLVLLRNCIRDVEQDLNSLRNFYTNVSNEIYVSNEKIKGLLDANQKRINLLDELNKKLNIAEYKRSCYIEEFMDLVPFNVLRDFYNGLLKVSDNKDFK